MPELPSKEVPRSSQMDIKWELKSWERRWHWTTFFPNILRKSCFLHEICTTTTTQSDYPRASQAHKPQQTSNMKYSSQNPHYCSYSWIFFLLTGMVERAHNKAWKIHKSKWYETCLKGNLLPWINHLHFFLFLPIFLGMVDILLPNLKKLFGQ